MPTYMIDIPFHGAITTQVEAASEEVALAQVDRLLEEEQTAWHETDLWNHEGHMNTIWMIGETPLSPTIDRVSE